MLKQLFQSFLDFLIKQTLAIRVSHHESLLSIFTLNRLHEEQHRLRTNQGFERLVKHPS